MKRLGLVLAMVLVLVASQVMAGPYLVCDPADNVTYYILDIDGVEYTVSYPMHFDLAFLDIGSHTAIATAGNPWGESNWSTPPFQFSAGPPSPPSGMGLSAQ